MRRNKFRLSDAVEAIQGGLFVFAEFIGHLSSVHP